MPSKIKMKANTLKVASVGENLKRLCKKSTAGFRIIESISAVASGQTTRLNFAKNNPNSFMPKITNEIITQIEIQVIAIAAIFFWNVENIVINFLK